MAFSVDDRVKVTSQKSPWRAKLGTVEIEAASDPNSLNQVRLDGYPVGKTVGLTDGELHATGHASPITY